MPRLSPGFSSTFNDIKNVLDPNFATIDLSRYSVAARGRMHKKMRLLQACESECK
jgi:hypothetical protein